jgi:DNA-3-methyladenine glycosylase
MSSKKKMVRDDFFDRDAQDVAKDLLGKVLERQVDDGMWLSVRIIETEAYYGDGDRGSHASLGFTAKRKALFMQPATIYMYYSRGGDSLNFTCHGGRGDAVLIKSGIPANEDPVMLAKMRLLNPSATKSEEGRDVNRLCNGQTLLCKSLGLKVPEWDGKRLDPDVFRLVDHRRKRSCKLLGWASPKAAMSISSIVSLMQPS